MATDDDRATEHLLRLGKIAANGQVFELTIGMILAQSLGVGQEEGSIVAAALGVRGALRVIGDLAKRPDFPLEAEAVREWLKVAAKANSVRNDAIHSPWAADAEGGELRHKVGRGLTLESRTPSDLDNAVRLLREAMLSGQRLLKTVTLEPE